MLEIILPEQFFGIKLYRKHCNNVTCNHKSNDIDCNNGYWCFSPKNALFVRHARINKKGIKYAYGEYICCAKIVFDGEYDMFASSEKNLMREIL